LFSYLSKLNKELQANQGHQRWAATQIFQIRFFLVYLGLLKGDKSDSSIFRTVIFGFYYFYYFLLSFWGYYYLFESIVSGLHISPSRGVHKGFFKSRVNINKGITKHVRLRNFQINKLLCCNYCVLVG
jgi:hypothetical protein